VGLRSVAGYLQIVLGIMMGIVHPSHEVRHKTGRGLLLAVGASNSKLRHKADVDIFRTTRWRAPFCSLVNLWSKGRNDEDFCLVPISLVCRNYTLLVFLRCLYVSLHIDV
jgi:hypothetical protein